MKKQQVTLKLTLLVACILSFTIVGAQELAISKFSSTELSKDARKEGRYAGTYINDGSLRVIYAMSNKTDGIQIEQYNFDKSLSFKDSNPGVVSGEKGNAEYPWYKTSDMVDKVFKPNQQYISATAAFGGAMKFKLGSLYKNYFLDVYTGMGFSESEELKAKTGDIWRILPSGYKTTSDIDAIATENGFYNELPKFGNPLIAPADKDIIAVGVITEKVSIRNPPKTNGNRIAAIAINGNDFNTERYNIYIWPYSALTVTSGLGEDDNLSVLFAPLNAPSTVAEHKPLLWKEHKNNFSLARFNDSYELVDSVSFDSELMWGNYQIFNGGSATVIAAYGNSKFDGWCRNFGVTKLNAVQVSKIKGAKLLYSSMYGEDELEDKLVMPSDMKAKYNLAINHNTFKEVVSLPNGDDFVIGTSDYETYALQVAPSGELKAFYRFPRIDDKGGARIYNYQIMAKGDELVVVLNEQPVGLTNDAKIETSYVKGPNTTFQTTTVEKLNEVFLKSQVIKVNYKTLKMSNRLLVEEKDSHTLGSFPALFTTDAIYFTTREKGHDGKEIGLMRVDL